MKRPFALAFAVVFFACGCGVKTHLVPPDVRVPKRIQDLKGEVRDKSLVLRWGIPEENADGSRPVDLVHLRILRREERGGCIECPGEFSVREELDLRKAEGYTVEDGVLSWVDTDLEDGVIYVYKVVGVNHWGYAGEPSNEVVIKWPPATTP